MLHGEAAEIADALSRVCVMRTEDYTLLRDIKRVARHRSHTTSDTETPPADGSSLDQRYLRHVSREFREREEWRQTQSQQLLGRLDAWSHRFFRRESLAEAQSQLALGDANTLYATLVQSTYALDAAVDLTASPFASTDFPSRFLYNRSAVLPSTVSSSSAAQRDVARYVGRAQQVLFGQTLADLTRTATHTTARESARRDDDALHSIANQAEDVADALYPLLPTAAAPSAAAPTDARSEEDDYAAVGERDVDASSGDKKAHTEPMKGSLRFNGVDRAVAVKPGTRDRLRESRHVWTVLLLLWTHTLIQRQLAISSSNKGDSTAAPDASEPHQHGGDARAETAEGEEETLLMSALLSSAKGFVKQQQTQFLKVLEAVEALAA